MKFSNTFLLFYLFTLSLSGQSYTDKEGKPQLWGNVALDSLNQAPYADWYDKNYNSYSSTLSTLEGNKFQDLKVKIFIGTWCGDTKYLLPRFIKTWQQLGLSESQLEIIAVHHESELYKQGPKGETEGYNIHRVPTFIFEKNGEELNRIVERTVFDLDTDLVLIADKQPYQPRYKAVQLVSKALDTLEQDSLVSDHVLKGVRKSIQRELSLASELNTYAYVLYYSGQHQKAEFVFKLNKALFPYDPYIIHGYGRVLMNNKKFEEAKNQLLESLRIEPDNPKAISYLADINKQLAELKKTD